MQIGKKTKDKYFLRKFKRRNPSYFNWWYIKRIYTGVTYKQKIVVTGERKEKVVTRKVYILTSPVAFDGIVPIFPQGQLVFGYFRNKDDELKNYRSDLGAFINARYYRKYRGSYRTVKSTRITGKKICEYYFNDEEAKAEGLSDLGKKLWT